MEKTESTSPSGLEPLIRSTQEIETETAGIQASISAKETILKEQILTILFHERVFFDGRDHADGTNDWFDGYIQDVKVRWNPTTNQFSLDFKYENTTPYTEEKTPTLTLSVADLAYMKIWAKPGEKPSQSWTPNAISKITKSHRGQVSATL